MTTQAKTRTITMTNQPPVRIREDSWPVVAHGSFSDHDNEYEFQANESYKANIRVRQHQDGRAVVYGVYEYDTRFQHRNGITAKAGVLVAPGGDLVEAIREVGQTLTSITDEAGHEFGSQIDAAVRDCIAELPPVDL